MPEKLSDKYKPSQSLSQPTGRSNIVPPKAAAVVVAKKNVPRQPNITVIAGMTGCGKSWNLIDEIKACLVNNFDTGKKGRPVFLIETNYEDDYIREFPNTC